MEVKYFTVPIAMLRGVLSRGKDIRYFMQDVVRYSIYYHAVSLENIEKEWEQNFESQMKSSAKFLNVKIVV